MKKPNKKIKFREVSTTRFGKFLHFFGIEINKYQIGYFHQTGYSGKQKFGQSDIIIIEKEDGTVITIPKKEKFYRFI